MYNHDVYSFLAVASVLVNQNWTWRSLLAFAVGFVLYYVVVPSMLPLYSSVGVSPRNTHARYRPGNESNSKSGSGSIVIDTDVVTSYIGNAFSGNTFSVIDLTTKKGRIEMTSEAVKTMLMSVNDIVPTVYILGHTVEWRAAIKPGIKVPCSAGDSGADSGSEVGSGSGSGSYKPAVRQKKIRGGKALRRTKSTGHPKRRLENHSKG